MFQLSVHFSDKSLEIKYINTYKITITTTAFSNLSTNRGLKSFVVRKDMFRFEPIHDGASKLVSG